MTGSGATEFHTQVCSGSKYGRQASTAPGRFRNAVRRRLSEIAGPRVPFLALFPLLPLHELFKRGLGFFGRFFRRCSGGGFGNGRVVASLCLLKLLESFKQCPGVFGRRR